MSDLNVPARTAPPGARAAWFLVLPALAAIGAAVLLLDSVSIVGRDAWYPRALLICLLAIAGVAALRELRAAKREQPSGDVEGGRGNGVAWRPTAGVIAALAVTPLLLPTMGYVVSMAVLALSAGLAIGRRSWFGTIACALGVSFGSYAVFVLALGARIPSGALLP